MKGMAGLDVQDAVPEDSGVYECVASNPLGTTRTKVEVMVPGMHLDSLSIHSYSK